MHWTFVRSVGITRVTVIIICYKWISIILMRAERSAIVQMEMNNSEQSRLNKKKRTIQMTKWGKWEWEKKDQNDFYVSETRNSIWYQSNLIFNFNCNATFLKNVSNGFIQCYLMPTNERKEVNTLPKRTISLSFNISFNRDIIWIFSNQRQIVRKKILLKSFQN